MEKTEEKKTWQGQVADDVLSIAVAIMAHGADKHDVKIGIDAAVQAAAMAYCSERARDHWGEERRQKEMVKKALEFLDGMGNNIPPTTPESPRPVQE